MDENEKLYIIELSYSDSMNREPLYLLTRAGLSAVDRPVMRLSSILAVNQFTRTAELLEHSGPEFQSLGSLPTDVHSSVSAADAINVARDCDDDPTGHVIRYINFYLDLAIAVEQVLPPKYKKALWDLADHMTFTSSVADFFIEGRSRTTYVNAMIWLYGAVDIKIDIL